MPNVVQPVVTFLISQLVFKNKNRTQCSIKYSWCSKKDVDSNATGASEKDRVQRNWCFRKKIPNAAGTSKKKTVPNVGVGSRKNPYPLSVSVLLPCMSPYLFSVHAHCIPPHVPLSLSPLHASLYICPFSV